jgi:hypothetical protein
MSVDEIDEIDGLDELDEIDEIGYTRIVDWLVGRRTRCRNH